MTTDDPIIRAGSDLSLTPIVASDRKRCVELLNDFEIARRMLRVPHPYGSAEFDKFLTVDAASTEQQEFPLHYAIRHAEHGLIG